MLVASVILSLVAKKTINGCEVSKNVENQPGNTRQYKTNIELEKVIGNEM